MIVCDGSQLGSLDRNELFGGQMFLVSGPTYFLSPRFLSIHAHETLLIRKTTLNESILTHLAMYGTTVAALLDNS